MFLLCSLKGGGNDSCCWCTWQICSCRLHLQQKQSGTKTSCQAHARTNRSTLTHTHMLPHPLLQAQLSSVNTRVAQTFCALQVSSSENLQRRTKTANRTRTLTCFILAGTAQCHAGMGIRASSTFMTYHNKNIVIQLLKALIKVTLYCRKVQQAPFS